LFVSRPWNAQQEYLDALWMFVYEEYRVSDRLQALVRFAKWVSGEVGRPLMMVNATKDPVAFADRDTEQLRARLVADKKSSARFVTGALHEIWRSQPGMPKDVAVHREIPRSGSVFLWDPVGVVGNA
jgi:hypothetical protein